MEGQPGIVKAVRVGETDIVLSCAVLAMAALHPLDKLQDSGLSGYGEAAHAA